MNSNTELIQIRDKLLEIHNFLFKQQPEPEPVKKEKELLTAEEVMAFLSISRNTFSRMVREGLLQAYRFNRRIYCKRSEIIQALEQRPLEVDSIDSI